METSKIVALAARTVHMRLLTPALASAFLALAAPAVTQDMSDAGDRSIHDEIERMHGDADGFDEAFLLVTQAFTFGDPVTIADLSSYPLKVFARSETYEIFEAQDLLTNYADLLQPQTQNRLASQSYDDLFVNSDGVMFGNGALWMSNLCLDDACSETSWSIITLNDDAG